MKDIKKKEYKELIDDLRKYKKDMQEIRFSPSGNKNTKKRSNLRKEIARTATELTKIRNKNVDMSKSSKV